MRRHVHGDVLRRAGHAVGDRRNVEHVCPLYGALRHVDRFVELDVRVRRRDERAELRRVECEPRSRIDLRRALAHRHREVDLVDVRGGLVDQVHDLRLEVARTRSVDDLVAAGVLRHRRVAARDLRSGGRVVGDEREVRVVGPQGLERRLRVQRPYGGIVDVVDGKGRARVVPRVAKRGQGKRAAGEVRRQPRVVRQRVAEHDHEPGRAAGPAQVGCVVIGLEEGAVVRLGRVVAAACDQV